MALTITKAKAKTKTAPTNVIDAVVQSYVANRLELEAKLAKLAALQKAVKADEEKLLAYADELVKPEEDTELTAGDYVVKIGAKGRKAVAFDKALIKEEIGADVYEEIANFSIEDLKKYMTGKGFEKAVTYEHANKRKVVVEEADKTQ